MSVSACVSVCVCVCEHVCVCEAGWVEGEPSEQEVVVFMRLCRPHSQPAVHAGCVCVCARECCECVYAEEQTDSL